MIKDGKVRLLTRTGQDWTATFRSIATAAARFPCRQAIVDGEVMVLDSRGVSDFQSLQNTIRAGSQRALVYSVFDLPFAEGWDLRECTLKDRKELLRAAIEAMRGGADSGSGTIRYSDHIVGRGEMVFSEAKAAGLEGIISKRIDAPYESRRSNTWLKIKSRREADFVVVGYTEPEGSRVGLGALVLAKPHPGDGLVYGGRVGTGFDTKTLHDLHRRFAAIERKTPPIPLPANPEERKGVHWVEPLHVASVEYGSITRDGYVRHAVYRGLRPDMKPEDVQPGEILPTADDSADVGAAPRDSARERARAAAGSRRPKVARASVVRPSSRPGAVKVGGVEITNADRVVYPGIGVTKGQVAEYYHGAADRMLPFVAGRPLSVIRAPKGLAEPTFFQRHPMESMPKSVKVVTVPGHEKRYIRVDDAEGLLTLVQFGGLEFHPWACQSDRADRADILTFDLDPGEGVPWEGLRAAALALRELLRAEGLESFVKTSGGKGLHVVIPIEGIREAGGGDRAPRRRGSRSTTARRHTPGAPWDRVREFDEEIGARIVRAAPTRFTTNVRADRRGKIYVDYLRNRSAATSVAAYSLRARPGAPVSMPVSWDELGRVAGPADWTIANAADRLRGPDPWRGFFETQNRLPE
jgi:bifunctional non-homologous end joining protein LigD